MTLVLEDGTGLISTANSYSSVAEADTYHTTFNHADWLALDTSTKETALIEATSAIDLLYGQRYLSMPLNSTQPLLFPRFVMIINKIQVISSGRLPTQLKRAVQEVALMFANGIDIYPKPNTERNVKSNRVKIGELEQDVTYSNTMQVETFANFNKIDLILSPILKKLDGYMPSTLSF